MLINERTLLFASRVVLTKFRGGTSIEERRLPHPDYALMLICDAESAGGETATIELWHNIARGDDAITVKWHEGREIFRDSFNEDLEAVVATISDLGLVLTQLPLAEASPPYCGPARDLFLETPAHAGYR